LKKLTKGGKIMDKSLIKKDWVEPDLKVYGDVATLTRGGAPCVIKKPGFGDDWVQAVNDVGSSLPYPGSCP
jgi:hypothetical protein